MPGGGEAGDTTTLIRGSIDHAGPHKEAAQRSRGASFSCSPRRGEREAGKRALECFGSGLLHVRPAGHVVGHNLC